MKNIVCTDKGEVIFAQSKSGDGCMSFARGDLNTVIENRKQFLKQLNLDINNLTSPSLVHNNRVEIVDEHSAGKGAFSANDALPETDALVTNCNNLILAVTTADCLPVWIWSEDGEIIGIAHAGWKGLRSGIIKNLIKTAYSLNNTPLNRFHIKIGIGIKPCCYIVNTERLKYFVEYHLCRIHWREGEFVRLNLPEIAVIQAVKSGIPPENIETSPHCSCCNTDYPSYRRDGEEFKPNLAIIVKNP